MYVPHFPQAHPKLSLSLSLLLDEAEENEDAGASLLLDDLAAEPTTLLLYLPELATLARDPTSLG